MPDASQYATYARLLRLTPVEDPVLPVSVAPKSDAVESKPESAKPARRRWPKGMLSLALLVILPTLLALGYFWLLAADRYQSEARFILRLPGRTAASIALANIAPSMGITRSTDDGYIVQEFLESRDAMAWLNRHAHLREAYARPRRDFIWRFPNPLASDTDEGLYRHYQRMVSTSYDSSTGVNVLKVQAFSPADAKRLANALLDAAEALVNRLNARSRRDAIDLAEAEADRMRQRTLAAQAALTAFREREQLLDPGQATLAVLETIAALSQEATKISVELGALSKDSPNGPQIAPLRARRASLEEQIATQLHKLAGDARSIAPRIVEYERLMLEREFAGKALLAAMTSVEMARMEARRQQVYLERIAVPGEPDYPAYPWRVVWCLSILAAGFVAWRIWRIVAEDTLQHIEP